MNSIPKGLYGIADAAFGDPVELVSALAHAGCRVIQIRAKGCSETDIIGVSVAARRHSGNALLIINDSIEAAARSGADGVHLGQEDCSIANARSRLGPSAIIGLSTHSISQVQADHKADYIGFGPVFPTQGKLNAGNPRGVEALQHAVQASPVPVVAIGGINLTNIGEIHASGAHGWAIISALLSAPDLNATAQMLDPTLK